MLSAQGIVALFCLAIAICYAVFRAPTRKLLPSPKGKIISQHTFMLSKRRPWEQFDQWSSQCGPVFSLSVFGRRIIILNSIEGPDGLLWHRMFKSLSSRPFRLMAHLSGYARGLALIPDGKNVARTRKIIHDVMGPATVRDYQEVQIREVTTFVNNLFGDPSKLHENITLMSASIILSTAIGISPVSHEDSILRPFEQVSRDVSQLATPGRFWIDVIPYGSSIPKRFFGSKIVKTAENFGNNLEAIGRSYDDVFESIKNGTNGSNSVTSKLLNKAGIKLDAEYIDLVRYANLTLYAGAASTTTSAVSVFFWAMMLHPDIQKHAQSDIDAVVGRDRLPCLDDRHALPYIEGIVREVLRWYPPIPLTSRYVKEDQDCDDYIIPSGSSVVANIWSMARDPRTFHDPQSFDPQRYFRDGKVDKEMLEKVYQIVFGFGRRMCPGIAFSDRSLWLIICLSLAVFEISCPIDAGGQPYVPPAEFEEGYFSQLLPFEYCLKPRPGIDTSLFTRDEV